MEPKLMENFKVIQKADGEEEEAPNITAEFFNKMLLSPENVESDEELPQQIEL